MGNSVNQIMTLAKIRRFVDENMPEDLYVNVYEERKYDCLPLMVIMLTMMRLLS